VAIPRAVDPGVVVPRVVKPEVAVPRVAVARVVVAQVVVAQVVDPGLVSFFRLLDDFDQYSRGDVARGRHYRSYLKTFCLKFNVKEVADAYEFHGELPGIE